MSVSYEYFLTSRIECNGDGVVSELLVTAIKSSARMSIITSGRDSVTVSAVSESAGSVVSLVSVIALLSASPKIIFNLKGLWMKNERAKTWESQELNDIYIKHLSDVPESRNWF